MYRRTLLLAGMAGLVARPARARAERYLLQPETSVVGFTYTLNGQRINGRMPVKSADILLDVARPSNSRVSAVIDAASAKAGPFYATQAMKSAGVLDVENFPEILFVSKEIEGKTQGARVLGDLTIRGVAREVVLSASLFYQNGQPEGSLDRLSIFLTGRVDRRDFGASGFSNLVTPLITLNILTRVRRDV